MQQTPLGSQTSENRKQNYIRIELYRQVTAKCSMKALQNAPIGAFCSAIMLHLEIYVS